MIIKPGVRVFGIRPEMILVLMIADKIYDEYGFDLRWTGSMEGKHSRGSLHYIGAAIDLGIIDIQKAVLDDIFNDLNISLGDDYDVVLEKDHIHVEFQPKEPYTS